jgi:rhamnogalacturonyl hydrolase YesR
MFAYAMTVGLHTGLLSGSRYRLAVDRAWQALLGRVDPDGNVADVCIGTGKERELAYYLERPRVAGDLHGQAPLLWLATERLAAAKGGQ